MKFSLISSKGRHETERGSSALGKGLVACLLLMSVSCMLFVGTTMSWFTDQKTGTAGVITAGEFDVTLYIVEEGEEGKIADEITMTRVGSSNNLWEPGAVFTSPVMYVENTGTLDLEYRLDLQLKEMEEEAGANLNLLNVIEFRIVDSGTSLTVNSAVDTVLVERIFANTTIDQRTPGAENDTPVAGTAGVRALKAPTASTESDKSKSGSFIVVGRMKEDAENGYSGLTLEEPFTLVVTAQQSGFNWATLDATQTAP
ncbi:MAG: SipW-dependent-type signal peptide-containing protein [Hominicoprocola sp.]